MRAKIIVRGLWIGIALISFLTLERSALAQSAETLDGVKVEAVDSYPKVSPSVYTLGLTTYPFNAYYVALGVNASYAYNFSNRWAWEVVNASYFFTFDQDLKTQLVERFGVNPNRINRLNYMVSTNAVWTNTFGKFLFMNDYIRYFRVSLLGGAGVVATKDKTHFAPNIGLRTTALLTHEFSANLDVRHSVTVPNFSNYTVFTLSIGYNF